MGAGFEEEAVVNEDALLPKGSFDFTRLIPEEVASKEGKDLDNDIALTTVSYASDICLNLSVASSTLKNTII